jgi:hypothetical protein
VRKLPAHRRLRLTQRDLYLTDTKPQHTGHVPRAQATPAAEHEGTLLVERQAPDLPAKRRQLPRVVLGQPADEPAAPVAGQDRRGLV